MKQDFQTAFGNTSNKPNTNPVREKKRKTKRSHSPVTLRLTADERKTLETLAQGMTLSAYIRACIFEHEDKRRKKRPQKQVADKRLLSETLALLGQSRIANNLNQLAYQANVGALVIDQREQKQIEEAYGYVCELRILLIRALKA
ncbi:plasmid mobilization protein [Coralliovum pocilloporae]|uniref:plasmid mobilization protein n=1 Tax=Coralliovum pocilloporae TaxID=3066369 RepID=UPI003307BA1C